MSVTVPSRLLLVQRKLPPHIAAQSKRPTPVRQAQQSVRNTSKPKSRHVAATISTPIIQARASEPNPRSHALSRTYGAILPTSLIYIILLARGFTPWRPDAVMSTTRRETNSFPSIFMDRRERPEHLKKQGVFPSLEPYLRLIRFQGPQSC